MDLDTLRVERLRSHRLTAPAPTVVAAAEHMLATQAQEFWGGRWALAARTAGEPALGDVDAAFDAGRLVRSWTMRGTIHVIAPRDVAWVLSITGERQFRAAASRQRTLGLDDDALRRAERATMAALRGGGRLTRAELFALLAGIGIDPRAQRGVHVLYALAVRGVVVQGPVVPRASGPTREQYLVLADEWVADAPTPADPLAELFVRYVDGHGPAGVDDFAWWSGLPIGTARRAAEASAGRVAEVEEGRYLARPRPRRSASTPTVFALPPFDEYFLSYADRSAPTTPERVGLVATGGMMRPILVARGRIVGLWTQSRALGRHADDPVSDLWEPESAAPEDVRTALARYRAFITG